MSRMDRRASSRCLPAWMLVLLVFLVSCLSMHFLMEDSIMFSSLAVDGSSAIMEEELNHQDDLVFLFILPIRILPTRIISTLFDCLVVPAQPIFFHFEPPKI